jgi:hypothetical protein
MVVAVIKNGQKEPLDSIGTTRQGQLRWSRANIHPADEQRNFQTWKSIWLSYLCRRTGGSFEPLVVVTNPIRINKSSLSQPSWAVGISAAMFHLKT